MTVHRLRAWMDQPEAMGLPRELQNLVILGFALQSNLTFALHGGPVQPQLEHLDDGLELHAQPLPSAAMWQEATQRAQDILDTPVPPLLNAANTAQFVAQVQQTARECCHAVEQLCTRLRHWLETFNIEAHSAPRMQTAQATLVLVSGLREADKDRVIQGITKATIATSATAMREVIARAADQATALERTPSELFERLSELPAERAPHARALVETVKDLLTRDEHVISLVKGLQEAQSAAIKVFTDLVESAAPPGPHGASRPPVPLPAPSKSGMASSQRDLVCQDAAALFDTITKALASDPRVGTGH